MQYRDACLQFCPLPDSVQPPAAYWCTLWLLQLEHALATVLRPSSASMHSISWSGAGCPTAEGQDCVSKEATLQHSCDVV